MTLHYQILLKSPPPLTFLAGSATVLPKLLKLSAFKQVKYFTKKVILP